MPEEMLKQVYELLSSINKKKLTPDVLKKEWQQLTANSFLKGYADEDSIYDKL